MDFKTEHKFNLKPAKLLELLTSEEYLIAKAKFYHALEAKVEYSKKTKTEVSLIVRTKEHGRNMAGGIDKSSTETAEDRQVWDLKALTCKWKQHRPSFGDKIVIEGSYKIVADGSGSTLVSNGIMEVKIPLLGKKIAADKVKKLENDGGKFQGFVEEYLKK